jgi:hypothetical protein
MICFLLLNRRSSFPCAARAAVLAAPVLLFAAPAAARPPANGSDLCGNGYCDAWNGESADSCPADCAGPGWTPPPPPAVVDSPRPWTPAQAIPPFFHVEERSNVGIVFGGTITLCLSYFSSLAIGLGQGVAGGGYAAIPIAGPFIAAVYNPASPAAGLYRVGLANVGLVEIAGAAMLIAGATTHSLKLVPDRPFTILPVPLAGRSGNGLGLVGTF